VVREDRLETVLSSRTKQVVISENSPTVLVGERISGSKEKLSAAIKKGDMSFVREEALGQAQVGADMLDVNISVAGYDEAALLAKAVRIAMDTVDLPLCLDSANPKALESALLIYEGKALLNSVTGESKSLNTVLPLARDHGAAVIGLVVDEEGISDDPKTRTDIARRIVDRAETFGVPPEDVIIDCLIQSVGADSKAAIVTLETIKQVKMVLPNNLTVGASNISFGLPDRSLINGAFLAMAIAAGASCAIVDIAKARPIILAADLLMNRDKFARRYVAAYRQRRGR
jgi:5-methyltetrahydrofolate--homocysteine methyltransferase